MAGISSRIGIGYVLDWAVVVLFAVGGGILNRIDGFHRPFSLRDTTIAYPNQSDIVSVPVLVIVALAAPAVIIGVGCFGAGAISPHGHRSIAWRRALWETHIGWLGLCTGLAITLFVTSGLKDIVGKPRPNLLSRCMPTFENVHSFIVGGFGDGLDSEADFLVSSKICTQVDKRTLDDCFAAFPSGHSSFAAAGMVYLSLWLCARFSLHIPFLSPLNKVSRAKTKHHSALYPVQHVQAAPPTWQLALAFTPVGVALFICASRFADYHHAGWDITAGALIGTIFGWSSFRLYHLPLNRSRGIIGWGPRKPRHAFVAGDEEEEEQDITTRGTVRIDEEAEPPTTSYELNQGVSYELHEREVGRPPRAVVTPRTGTDSSTEPIVSGRVSHPKTGTL